MATKKLTEKALETLPPATTSAQDYYWDTETKGFGVVVGRTGIRTFVARAWVAGKKRRVKIGIAGEPRADGHTWSVALARIEAKGLLGRMSGGEDPNATKRAPRAGGPTLRAALEFHIGKMERGENRRGRVCSPASIRTTRGSVELHLAEWLDRPIVELTADAIAEVMCSIEAEAARVGGSNPKNPPGRAAANRIIANVSAIWRSWHKRHGLPVSNPTERLTPAALKPRTTRIDNDGFVEWHTKVLAMENPVRRDLQLVSLFTGVRSEGVRNIRWEDVDADRGLLHIAKAKGDQPYTLPLVATVRGILEKRRKENAAIFGELGGDHGFVFPSLSRDMRHVQAVAEVKERRTDKTKEDDDGNPVRVQYLPGIHANRRTFNSVAIEIGIPPEPRNALMNHEGRGVNVKHYGVPQTWDYVRECAEKIEAALWQRLKPTRATKLRGKLRAA